MRSRILSAATTHRMIAYDHGWTGSSFTHHKSSYWAAHTGGSLSWSKDYYTSGAWSSNYPENDALLSHWPRDDTSHYRQPNQET